VGKHCSNPQYFKGKNYKMKFLTSSILKKIDKDNFRKKKGGELEKKGK